MGTCSSKDDYHPIVQNDRSNTRPASRPNQRVEQSRSTQRGDVRPSQPKATTVKSNERSGQRSGASRNSERNKSSKRRPKSENEKSSGHQNGYSKKVKEENGVQFQEFKDRERNVVSNVLESNRHLKMASVAFNELKLEKKIGNGAFGEVIKGTYCGTPVVVKRMLRNKIDENNLRMFADEILLLMNLRHPNIVQFIGASWNSYSNVCFVTEYLSRGDLYAVLRNPKYKLTWEEPVLRMMIDTARGMAYLHSMNPPIIHRDLKSMNILVSSTFSCKVSDFGLSREKADDETMSITGTPLWLPPEMIRGERYTEAADVYSFGIVISEFDTRKQPYHDVKAKGARHKRVSGSTLMHMVAYEGLRPSLSPNCMQSVQSLYQRCTSNDASIRPTFEQIVAELEDKVQNEIRAIRKEDLMIASPLDNDAQAASELGIIVATKYPDEMETVPEHVAL